MTAELIDYEDDWFDYDLDDYELDVLDDLWNTNDRYDE